jgi:hypothetical protein
VISVIVYGRNDAHGYNLHRRAALSLNCIAEVLTDPEDEILFVDYNTADELPTFVEALSDTLTERCLALLRVLRVPAALHRERFAARSHLPVIEPVARNAAARRSSPSSRWLLSTNSDMIFLPLGDHSLTEICAELPDGFYGLPRFELPEWLWERLPRSDPKRALRELERLGPSLRLDEPTISNEWIRFDAPGDFQLVRREDYFAVDGCDEAMVLGWHVDSNLSRRLFLHQGPIQSLGDRLAGYHCNHNRTPTVYHGTAGVANDLNRFFYSVDRAALPGQRTSWGLADVELEEVRIRERTATEVASAVATAIPSGPAPPEWDVAAAAFALTYDSGHVLPFVADSLMVSSGDAKVGYLGSNPVLEEMLGTVVDGLALGGPLAVANLEDDASVDHVVRDADVFVVDLGVDASLDGGVRHAEFQPKLDRAFAALQRLIEFERARIEGGGHPRRLVLVNSSSLYWDAFVLAHLDCSHTTAHSRVRRATVKLVADDDALARAAGAQARRLALWSDREEPARLRLRTGETVEIGKLDDYRGFGDGWAFPEDGGIWTQGKRSTLAVAFDGLGEGDYDLALAIRGVCIGPTDVLKVDVLVDGARVATHQFSQERSVLAPVVAGLTFRAARVGRKVLTHSMTERLRPTYRRLTAPYGGRQAWHVELPPEALAERAAEVTFEIDEPLSPLALGWSPDDRPLGILLHSLALKRST